MYEREKNILHKKLKGIFEDVIPVGFFVAGGALTSLFSTAQINDLDLFFLSGQDFDAVNLYFKGTRGLAPSFITPSAISYKVDNETIQLIRKIYGTEQQIIDKFDFTVCQATYNPQNKTITMGDNFLYDLSRRRLFYLSGDFPIASLWRVKKFIKKGFEFPPIEAIKLALRINSIGIKTFGDLKEQLDGIDTEFLKELTDKYLDKGEEAYDYEKALSIMEEVLSERYGIE